MPLTYKGKRLLAKLRKTHGELAEEVFYRMISKYDDSALGEQPPKIQFQVGQVPTAGAESNRIPAGVQKADGTENIRGEGQTKTSTRAKAGNGTTRYPAIDRFSGENV